MQHDNLNNQQALPGLLRSFQKFAEDKTQAKFIADEDLKDDLDIQRKRQELEQDGHKHTMRFAFGKRLFTLLKIWLAGTFIIMLLAGFHIWNFHLPNSVLIAFIGTTMVNVIGTFLVFAKWLYPKI